MLPTFIIALREGVEASLIVGIIAAFLVKEGRKDALAKMWFGVGIAVGVCVAIAVFLQIADNKLPQKQQEGLETVVGLIAVSAVTYMIFWMRRNARGLKQELQEGAARALASGSTGALIGMAFLAVLREGFETAVFLLAVFQDTSNTTAAGAGAVLGLVAAVVIGYLLYRGGVRINLAKFFRFTGFVLALVAAGLVASAIHTAHEAGWLNSFQNQALDLTWLVGPGTVRGALLTGMLGLQPQPTVGEVAGWLIYAIPVGLYVAWPDSWRPWRRRRPAGAMVAGGMALLAVAGLIVAGCGSSGGSGSAGGSSGSSKHVAVKLTDAGCSPAQVKVASGPTTFDVTNDGAAAVTELEILKGSSILGEIENIASGLHGSFSLTLQPGTYTLNCPGGSSAAKGTLTVTGRQVKAAADPALAAAVASYRRYLEQQTGQLVTHTQSFAAEVREGDVGEAKELYPSARAPYERIEPVAESFGSLDPDIDARAGDVPASKWTGFHPIERSLWIHDSARGQNGTATKLFDDVELLQRKVRSVKLEPSQIANGAVELLGEVSKSKITGEEERYSHIDLVDFEANVAGSRAAFDAVAPILQARNAALATQVDQRFGAVAKALDGYRRGDGFVSYTELTRADKRKLSQAIDALAEPLSKVPALVVV
ncbi:MAG TPA: iron uptake system protein EfeO [Thermoleophilaceae bacterium]